MFPSAYVVPLNVHFPGASAKLSIGTTGRIARSVASKESVCPSDRLRLADCSAYNAGDVITVDTFAAGEKVDITGITKGHGYSGAVKRWGHHILRMTHGTGPVHRQVGSMGANSTPSRVYKNKKMAGQYGNEQVTILNLAVVKIDAEKNLIAVKGAVPGAKGSIVFIRDSVKA